MFQILNLENQSRHLWLSRSWKGLWEPQFLMSTLSNYSSHGLRTECWKIQNKNTTLPLREARAYLKSQPFNIPVKLVPKTWVPNQIMPKVMAHGGSTELGQITHPLPDTEGHVNRCISQVLFSQDKSRINGKAVELSKTSSHKQKWVSTLEYCIYMWGLGRWNDLE